VVTPDGLPLAYEGMAGHTSEKTPLKAFLEKIEQPYGRAKRTGVMDRGIPTEEVRKEMREASWPVAYRVGRPRGRLSKLEKEFLQQPWAKVQEAVEGKLLTRKGELYLLAGSEGRRQKERAIRRRWLKPLWERLRELPCQERRRDDLLRKRGAAKAEAGRVYRLVEVPVPKPEQPVHAKTFPFALRKDKLRQAFRSEGHDLLRSNLSGEDPALLWQHYVPLTEIEAVFRALKNDLAIRPIPPQRDSRIEAPIFVSFLAYCLYVTLGQRLRVLAPGRTPRAVLEKRSAVQRVDVRVPTTDGWLLILPRYTQPEKEHRMFLHELQLQLPAQPPPRIVQQEIGSVGEVKKL
jgi:transposase